MAVPARSNEKSVTTGDSGDLRAMLFTNLALRCLPGPDCSVGNEDLCCDHFVLRCYEFLQQIDARALKKRTPTHPSSDLKSAINSCLQGGWMSRCVPRP